MSSNQSSNIIDLTAIKALSKEQRIFVAREIRKDADLWNAVNGVGGLSELSDKARIQGTITKKRVLLPNAIIQVLNGETKVLEITSNQLGYFKTDIIPGNYNVRMIASSQSEEISVKALKGVVSTVNHDFKDGGSGVEFPK